MTTMITYYSQTIDILQCLPVEKHLADDEKILFADEEEHSFTDNRKTSLTY